MTQVPYLCHQGEEAAKAKRERSRKRREEGSRKGGREDGEDGREDGRGGDGKDRRRYGKGRDVFETEKLAKNLDFTRHYQSYYGTDAKGISKLVKEWQHNKKAPWRSMGLSAEKHGGGSYGKIGTKKVLANHKENYKDTFPPIDKHDSTSKVCVFVEK